MFICMYVCLYSRCSCVFTNIQLLLLGKQKKTKHQSFYSNSKHRVQWTATIRTVQLPNRNTDTHTDTVMGTYTYICMLVCFCIWIHALAKREQDFCSISLSLQISLMSNLLTFGCSSHAGNLWRIVWANWFLRLRVDLPLHYVGTLFVTVLWVFPMPTFKYLFRMSNKPVSSSSGVSQYCRIYETRSSTIATLCKSLSWRLSSADSS